MKKQFFEIEKDGFYGTYYENPNGSDCAFIGLFGDDPNDYMAKCGAKWLHKNGVNVLCVSPGKKNYSHVNNPLERIETAIGWLKSNGNRKIGIMGMSTAGMDSLVAASFFLDITLTFALTASDFVWQGFEQGNKDGCKEWPVPGTSTLSWKGEPLRSDCAPRRCTNGTFHSCSHSRRTHFPVRRKGRSPGRSIPKKQGNTRKRK